MGLGHAVRLVSIYSWRGRNLYLTVSAGRRRETLLWIEAQRARLAAGPPCFVLHVDYPSGMVCMWYFDAGERWTGVLKMLAQMASTSPS